MTKTQDEGEIVVQNTDNQNVLYIVIIVLLIIIAVGAFFLGMKLGETNNGQTIVHSGTGAQVAIADDIVITIYDDKRCDDCQTDVIVGQLQQAPVLTSATFVNKDFSDEGVADFLEQNGISTLPAAIFSTNGVGPDLAQYLALLPSGEYSLALGATHDPFIERSAKGFLVANPELVKEIKATAYYNGPSDAKITWLEYTDVNCGYCKKMETDGTAKAVLAEFPEDLNKTTSNYVGVGGAATQKAAEILECIGKLGGAVAYNNIMSTVLSEGDNSESTMLSLASNEGLQSDAVKSCLDNGEMKDLVAQKFSTGAERFGITGTPGNVIINNETGEYKIVSGAYPADTFIATVNELLAE